MKLERRSIEVFSMSFLDVVSCGFGAVILLLVLVLALEPATREQVVADLSSEIESVRQEREDIEAEIRSLELGIAAKQSRLREIEAETSALQARLDSTTNEPIDARQREDLESVLQELDKEMQNLLARSDYEPPPDDATIGGIPIDSEYVVFIVDTSGSMTTFAWNLVVAKIEEVLTIYPRLKGIQVMNDMGQYLFNEYAGRWIPDTPSRRRIILRNIRSWKSRSNSSPVEGITRAIQTFTRTTNQNRISLYVFGDDFSSGSGNVAEVLNRVARLNKNSFGEDRVRIHAIGFPVLFQDMELNSANRLRFSHLMRTLTAENGGTFVGLTDLTPKPRTQSRGR